MKKSLHPGWTLASALGFLGLSVQGFGVDQEPVVAPPTPEQIAFFETKIRPVLAANCYSCHGKDMQMAGLRLDTALGFKKGGDTGALVAAGDPDKSLLIQAVRQSGKLKMPPKGKVLKPNEIADLEAWVKMGAPWPAGKAVAEKGKGPLWSLLPVKNPQVPKVKNAAWVANPIDAFILAKLEAKKLMHAPAADRRTLLRRVTFDLTGLPPTPEAVDAFVADKSPQAYEKVVDRLLASPSYGERWARHWLDVARYADTKGYMFEEDRNYPNAYTYREWVIEAFNKDLPYDQFIAQQLAADRLPETQGDDKRALAALGFLTVGRRFLNNTPDIIDDRIDVTMRGFQGFTVACARCHDHKFDPIPTQDYYSLYGVFNSSEEAVIPISEKAVREPWAEHNAKIAETERVIREGIVAQVKKLRDRVKAGDALTLEAKATLQALREETVPTGDVLKKLTRVFEPEELKRIQGQQRVLDELQRKKPPTPEFAMAMVDRPNPGDMPVFKRGNPGIHGEVAPRRFLQALVKPGADREQWKAGSGRLELAKAIASRENPLTARVFVNRVWQYHFGAGLVRTPSDFGFQGEKPTHPELLDYLATSFMNGGWSVKKLHRQIVLSSTYRQSSTVSQAAYEADPENLAWGRTNRRRLDLEQMRDAVMNAAGRLDLSRVGGKSVDIWAQPFAPRRAVYGFVERQNLPGIFRTFDFASPDSTSPRRFLTTVPQQALFLMNSPFAIEQAKGVLERPEIKEASSDGQRLRRIYRVLFGRLPDAEEEAAGLAYVGKGPVATAVPIWRYGYGEFDAASSRLKAFKPLSNFANGHYIPAKDFPDKEFSYLIAHGNGGHPGRDTAHAVVWRWTAPFATTVSVEGTLAHGQKDGDGVRARVVASSAGMVGEWRAHQASVATPVKTIGVAKGETLDFIVDCIGGDNSDSFTWSPTVRSLDGKQVWAMGAAYGPPPEPPLSRWALYAQALMMTNEFMFVD